MCSRRYHTIIKRAGASADPFFASRFLNLLLIVTCSANTGVRVTADPSQEETVVVNTVLRCAIACNNCWVVVGLVLVMWVVA